MNGLAIQSGTATRTREDRKGKLKTSIDHFVTIRERSKIREPDLEISQINLVIMCDPVPFYFPSGTNQVGGVLPPIREMR